MKIDSIQIDNGVILAPLAGITNLPHRLLAKAAGASLVCSEMVSANGLIRASQKTLRLLDSQVDEKPLSVQMFGHDPSVMAEAACIIESMGADIVDINFGCSVKKVVKTGAGVALMKNAGHAETLLKTVRKAIRVPLTIKIRSGWDISGKQAIEIAKIAEFQGVDAIAIHPRTATQGFRGTADWSLISRIKQIVSIPVIGNGDINTWQDAIRMTQETGCDAVMIGRAAIGNPFLLTQTALALKGETPQENNTGRQLGIIRKYLRNAVEYLGEKHAMYTMRSRLGWFVKGLPYNCRFRDSIKQLTTESEALDLINNYQKDVEIFLSKQ
ncbi:MAG: tRNA dihydrouridine synthase DusB [Desulfobacterales bacterium]|jgi:nifR3 family TIM-barrel protein|nr:tRNA dihydrouridine synthase DusB [Desulfobacterales bacterium]